MSSRERSMPTIQLRPPLFAVIRGRFFITLMRWMTNFTIFFARMRNSRVGFVPASRPITPSRVFEIPSSDGTRTVTIHSYDPEPRLSQSSNNSDQKATRCSRPPAVHINFHGSGFVIPSLGLDSEYCAALSFALCDTIILNADYAKGPEYPYPAAIDDALAIFNYVFAHPLTYDITRISIGGGSAGGCIAILTALHPLLGLNPRRNLSNGPIVKTLVAWYPVTTFTASQAERTVQPLPPGAPGFPLNHFMRQTFTSAWVPAGTDLGDERISPWFVDINATKQARAIGKSEGLSMGNWPPAIFIVGENDPLYIDSAHLYKRLAAATLAVQPTIHKSKFELITVPNAGHAFERVAKPGTPQGAARAQAMDRIIARLRDVEMMNA